MKKEFIKRVRVIEDPSTFTVRIIKDEVERPAWLSDKTFAELNTQYDLMLAKTIQNYQENGHWKIIEEG